MFETFNIFLKIPNFHFFKTILFRTFRILAFPQIYNYSILLLFQIYKFSKFLKLLKVQNFHSSTFYLFKFQNLLNYQMFYFSQFRNNQIFKLASLYKFLWPDQVRNVCQTPKVSVLMPVKTFVTFDLICFF